MIALREGLTLLVIGDEEGYCCLLEGLDDEGRPIRLRLTRPLVDRLVASCEEARREHEEMIASDTG